MRDVIDAKAHDIDPVVLIIALIAGAFSAGNRSAARIAHAVLSSADELAVDTLAQDLGLPSKQDKLDDEIPF